MRIAAVGTLNSVPPMLTGNRAGALDAVRAPGRPQQIGDQRDRARRDRACQHDRNHVAADVRESRAPNRAVENNVMNEVVKRRRSNQLANMPCGADIPHDFARPKCGASHVRGAVPGRGVNLSLRMMWRRRANFAKHGRAVSQRSGRVPMSPDALNSLFSLCIGFALAGALDQRISGAGGSARRASDCCRRAWRRRRSPPCRSWSSPRPSSSCATRCAASQIERRRFEFVMMATVLAGFWSLMSGTFFLMTLRAAGLLA